MKALVVYESMFGNTRDIAEAIAIGLREHAEVEVVDVALAPALVPADVDLVVAGGPTHAFSMSRESTRGNAVQRGADDEDLHAGLREWLHGLPPNGSAAEFAAFDTRVDIPLLPGSAAKSAAKAARHLGFRVAEPESFRVEGYEGPILAGELDRATDWGRSLVAP